MIMIAVTKINLLKYINLGEVLDWEIKYLK